MLIFYKFIIEKRLIPYLCICFYLLQPHIIQAQNQRVVELDASLVERNTDQSLKDAKVILFSETGDTLIKDVTNNAGIVRIQLSHGVNYFLEFYKKTYFKKRVSINSCGNKYENGLFCFSGISHVNFSETDSTEIVAGLVEMDPIRVNTVFYFKNIYYDYDKSYIRKDAAKELDKVVKMMKDYPEISIELGSHTDSRGSDSYNLKLSQFRADEAISYIKNNGVLGKRLTAVGYGEEKLTNNCTNSSSCTEFEHQQNRRTEIKITEITYVK